ncbi:MAG: protein kinase [Planctomycetota bacterium]|nr:protein kinase [Planctomycetota bacterium]
MKDQGNLRLPGGYSVRSLLGRGALGASYLAIKRGAREQRVFKILDHPEWLDQIPVLRVPGIWLGGKSGPGETAWIWSSHVPGGSLRSAMDRGTLSAARLGEILVRCLGILERVHAEDASHGCLKPENILLPEREGVVITDFGHLPLLRSKDEDAGSAYLFGRIVSRDVAPPFTYLPPEALEITEADSRSDVYALGAILREGMEGRGGRPPVPDRIQEVIRRLTGTPSRDYPSAGEARSLIEEIPEDVWRGLPLVAGKVEEIVDRPSEVDRLFSFVDIKDRPVPVAVSLPAELSVFDLVGGPPGSESEPGDSPTGGGGGTEPEPLDPSEALAFLESIKKKPEKEEPKNPPEAEKGSYGLVVMGLSSGAMREKIADLISSLMNISREEALERASEPVISVMRGVAKVEAEKAFRRFKQANISARITTRLKKQK